MKTKIIYQCEFCLKEYKTPEEAFKCEADCLKLTSEEYEKYFNLLLEEKEAFAQAECVMNDKVRERYDKAKAVKSVIEFQKKYGITDSIW